MTYHNDNDQRYYCDDSVKVTKKWKTEHGKEKT